MSLKTIETKAIISAQDQTGTTFQQISEKIKRMEFTAERASQASSKIGTSFAGLDAKAAKAAASIGVIGAAATLAASKAVSAVDGLAKSIINLGEEYDKLVRRQRAVLGINEGQQAPLIAQAKRIGATSPYNDIQVLQAQTALVQRGIPLENVEKITESSSVLAQALGIDLPDAAQKARKCFFRVRPEDGKIQRSLKRHGRDESDKRHGRRRTCAILQVRTSGRDGRACFVTVF